VVHPNNALAYGLRMTVLMGVEDPARVRDLRRMKGTAGAFLAVAAGVFAAWQRRID